MCSAASKLLNCLVPILKFPEVSEKAISIIFNHIYVYMHIILHIPFAILLFARVR